MPLPRRTPAHTLLLSPRRPRRPRASRALLVVAVGLAIWGLGPHAAQSADFSAPLAGPLIVERGFDPPSQPWLAGHRGVDLLSPPGAAIRSTGSGTVSFAGIVAGRGVIAIDHGPLRTTYEPVEVGVAAGDRVRAGQQIGRLAGSGWHCASPCLHWGAKVGEGYLDPLSLLRPAAVQLLPHLDDETELDSPLALDGGGLAAANSRTASGQPLSPTSGSTLHAAPAQAIPSADGAVDDRAAASGAVGGGPAPSAVAAVAIATLAAGIGLRSRP